MTEHDEKMESRVPSLCGMRLKLVNLIAPLSNSIDLADFKRIGNKYGFKLEEAIFGVEVVMDDGKEKSQATPLYRKVSNPNLLGIFYWDGRTYSLYSAKQV